jgi:hypothetical protein
MGNKNSSTSRTNANPRLPSLNANRNDQTNRFVDTAIIPVYAATRELSIGAMDQIGHLWWYRALKFGNFRQDYTHVFQFLNQEYFELKLLNFTLWENESKLGRPPKEADKFSNYRLFGKQQDAIGISEPFPNNITMVTICPRDALTVELLGRQQLPKEAIAGEKGAKIDKDAFPPRHLAYPVNAMMVAVSFSNVLEFPSLTNQQNNMSRYYQHEGIKNMHSLDSINDHAPDVTEWVPFIIAVIDVTSKESVDAFKGLVYRLCMMYNGGGATQTHTSLLFTPFVTELLVLLDKSHLLDQQILISEQEINDICAETPICSVRIHNIGQLGSDDLKDERKAQDFSTFGQFKDSGDSDDRRKY